VSIRKDASLVVCALERVGLEVADVIDNSPEDTFTVCLSRRITVRRSGRNRPARDMIEDAIKQAETPAAKKKGTE